MSALERQRHKVAIDKKSAKKRLREMLENTTDKSHGTITGYSYGCRCKKCRAAEYERKKRIGEKLKANPTDPRHGTAAGYQYGCRCLECSRANTYACKIRKYKRYKAAE